jgi:hypothetical protein
MLCICALPLFAAVFAVVFAADTSTLATLTVQVNSAETGKPIDRASVVVKFRHGLNPIKMKRLSTSWEVKTSQEGTATIPEIQMGEVQIQIIASNYQTFGGIFQLDKPEQTIAIKLNPPQPQYSEDAKSKK